MLSEASSSGKWQWDLSNKEDKSSIRLAEEVTQDRARFRKAFGNLFAKHKGTSPSTTLENLEAQIAREDFKLKDRAQSALGHATQIQQKYRDERNRGAKKAGYVAQNFIKSFADFLSAYSGIVDLIRGAGQVYGEIAYESLSVLFFLKVVLNKSGNDTKMTKLLKELEKSFPQLDDWTLIYPTATIKELVADVYKQVVLFARSVAVYFSQFHVRLWMAIGRPPSIGVDKTVTLIHSQLAEVNSEATRLLHKRNRDIHELVAASNNEIADLKESNQRLETNNRVLLATLNRLEEAFQVKDDAEERQILEALKEVLEIAYPCPESDIEGCKRSLDRAFSPRPRTPGTPGAPTSPHQQLVQMTTDLISKCDPYTHWTASYESCLLFLRGATRLEGRSGRGFTSSWLSPAAIYVTEEMREQQNRVAFFSCHPDIQGGRYFAKDILSVLIYQVLEWNPAILRHRHQQFLTVMQSTTWREGHNKREGIREMCKVLHQALENVRSDPGFAYIVLDRLDLCSSKLRYLLDSLMNELVMREPVRVKIMVIVDSTSEDWDTEDLSEAASAHVMMRDDWDQQRLSMTAIHQQNAIGNLAVQD